MLQIRTEATEAYDERSNEFINIPASILNLEHSLAAISKWESKWHTSYLSSKKQTKEQQLDYVRCMTLNEVDPNVYYGLSSSNLEAIYAYINDPMSAIPKPKKSKTGNNNYLVSERIYYWMVAYQIPFECENWHLSRLMNLIKICSDENQPNKKHSQKDMARDFARLNAARRAASHSKG